MIKSILKKILGFFSTKTQLKIKGYIKLGYLMDVDNCKTFNEKINHRKLYWQNDLFVLCADKYRAREYVEDKIGSEYIIPGKLLSEELTIPSLYKILEKHKDIVIKANHNSGPVYFVSHTDDEIKLDAVIKSINFQLKNDYGLISNETWYSKVQPRVYYEIALLDKDGNPPNDYKFHVFNSGKTKEMFLQVDYDRFSNHGRQLYDMEFNKLPYSLQYPDKNKKIAKPNNFKLMQEIAAELAYDFSYVRVDLYEFNESVYFGELTFASDGGTGRFSEMKYDELWGSLWRGDPKY